MSDGEREAYYEALHGQPPDIAPGDDPEEFIFEPSGCQFEGYRQASDGGGKAQAFYQAFGDDLQTLYARIEADSRVVAFHAEVGACVAEEGLQWTGFEDASATIQRRLDQVQPRTTGSQNPFEEAGLDPEQMSDREIDEFLRDAQRLDPEQLLLLAEIQADEIALAKRLVVCGGSPLDFDAAIGHVRVEYERAFLEEHAEALAELE